MWRIYFRHKRTFLVTLVVCVTLVRVLVLSLQPDDEKDTYEDLFKTRSGKQILSSPRGHLVETANKTEGIKRKLETGYVKESNDKRNIEKNDVENENLLPVKQKWFKRQGDTIVRIDGAQWNEEDLLDDNYHESNDFEHYKIIEQIEREESVAVTTDVNQYATDSEKVNESKASNPYSPEKVKLPARLLRAAYVENRYSDSDLYQFLKPPDSGLCPCGRSTVQTEVIVISEDDSSNPGDFDILIFVQDMGQKPLTPPVWRNIVLSAKEGQRRVYASIGSIPKVRYLVPSIPKSIRPFHWSLTYHSKSDMPTPYGRYQSFEYDLGNENRDKNWAEGKTSLVAWVSTEKSAMWKQDEFVKSLQDFFQIDLYGEGYETCNGDSNSCTENMKKYKFYLVLEDTCCSEYITTKLWRSFSWGVVPIVIGAPKEDYMRLAPPNSFIYADDFASPEDLGDYLRKLDNTDEFYNDYHQWRQEGEIIVDSSVRERSVADEGGSKDSSLYTCKTVCRVATKYVNETSLETEKFTGSYFDPRTSWWGKSCKACGSHSWISQFS